MKAGSTEEYLAVNRAIRAPMPKKTRKVKVKDDTELWDADPNCVHNVVSAPGGGIKCTRCTGWFCY